MKKFLLALTLLAPILQADPATSTVEASQTEQLDAQTVQFLTKFKALHSFCIAEYAAIEQLFKDCAILYSETFELLFALDQRGDEELQKKCHELHESLAPAFMDLNHLLNRVQEVHKNMATFNAMLEEATDYTAVTEYLLTIAQEMYTIRTALETIKKYEAAIHAEALALSQEN